MENEEQKLLDEINELEENYQKSRRELNNVIEKSEELGKNILGYCIREIAYCWNVSTEEATRRILAKVNKIK